MIVSHPLRLLSAGTLSGGAVILRPDFAARRRAVAGSPAHLAAKADELFATMIARRQAASAKPGDAEAALAAVAAGIDTASRAAPLREGVPALGEASWQPMPFVDPSAGLAALSASLAAVTHPRAGL